MQTYAVNCLVQTDAFLQYLHQLSDRALAPAIDRGAYGYIPATPASEASRIREFITTPCPAPEDDAFRLMRFYLPHDTEDVTISLAPDSHCIFDVTLDQRLLLIKVNSSQVCLVSEVPANSELQRVLGELRPVYAWVDTDWDLTPDGYMMGIDSDQPITDPPWSMITQSNSILIGPPLSQLVAPALEAVMRHTDPPVVRMIAPGTYLIQEVPGNQDERAAHLREQLGNVPASEVLRLLPGA